MYITILEEKSEFCQECNNIKLRSKNGNTLSIEEIDGNLVITNK